VTTVGRYASAFNTHDVGELQALLASSVRIDAAGAGYCLASVSRTTVVSSFTALFAWATRRMSLLRVGVSSLKLEGSTATIDVVYVLRGADRPISFRLRRGAVGWRISAIDGACTTTAAPAAPTPPAIATGPTPSAGPSPVTCAPTAPVDPSADGSTVPPTLGSDAISATARSTVTRSSGTPSTTPLGVPSVVNIGTCKVVLRPQGEHLARSLPAR